MSDKKPTVPQAFDFKLAYQVADANPGQIVEFNGQLPCGQQAFQKIVTVPSDQNSFTLGDALAAEFKGANSIIHSSSQTRGTHIIATFPQPALQ